MGGHQVTSHGSGDDGFDEDGYDESQRAEILEVTRDGPSDGTIITDLSPDIDTDDDEGDNDLHMIDGDVATEDDSVDQDESDIDEDIVQADFEDGSLDEDGDLDDPDDAALQP